MKDLLGRISIGTLLICLTLNFSSPVHAARLTDMVVSNTRDNLLLFVKVDGAFTEKMKQAVLSGIPTTFSFLIRVEKMYPFFPDHRISELKVNHTIKYDALRKNFIVKRSWEDDRQLTTDSFEEAQQWMSEIKSLPVASLDDLEKGVRYEVNTKAELDKVTLPFYLNYIFFFVSLWDFETGWQSVDFVY